MGNLGKFTIGEVSSLLPPITAVPGLVFIFGFVLNGAGDLNSGTPLEADLKA